MSLFRRALLTAAIGIVSASAPAQPAAAAIEVPFVQRFASSGLGDVATTANTLMTCPDLGGTEATCLAARAGTASGAALNNNGYAMERVDVDGDIATFDSSRSTAAPCTA